MTTIKNLAFVVSCVGLGIASLPGTSALAAKEIYAIDSQHTFPNFEISHLGYSVQRGRFNRTDGKLELDLVAKTGAIDITIDATSIDTGLEALEKHLRGEDFFNVAKYPAIIYRSNSFQFVSDKLTQIDGNLTLLGVTKPVRLNIDSFRCAEHPRLKRPACGASASTTIKRSDFGMKYGIPAVGDDVKIVISIEAMQSKESASES